MALVLVFHAEKLHEDLVWTRVEPLARWMSRRGIKATFFVYPFRAQVAGRDISDRVQTLGRLGHAIGQHTHFYSGTKIDGPDKVNDFNEANIAYCLRRDFETLCGIGVRPRGFSAGAWFVNDTVLDQLIEMSFAYDCSARFPKSGKIKESPHFRWLTARQVYENERGKILCVPTTCSLGEWFKWKPMVEKGEGLNHSIVYLHDYDLLSKRHYCLAWVFLLLYGKRLARVDLLDLCTIAETATVPGNIEKLSKIGAE